MIVSAFGQHQIGYAFVGAFYSARETFPLRASNGMLTP